MVPSESASEAGRLDASELPTERGLAAGQRVFGRYLLEKILGRGGMGVVWAARDEALGERIALKFLPDAVRWDPAAFDDLKAETRRARALTHPNIVRIHDFVEDASGAAISMELVDGRTLTELRLEKPNKILEPADIAPWLPQLCAALDYAHTQAKVVHRDLKPSNLMLTRDGVIKIADFGVARSLADSFTRVSMMSAGTLVYMSPQQAMGEDPAPSDDFYALGATLYELLTGKPPFHTGDVRLQLFQRKPESLASRRQTLGITGAGQLSPSWENAIAEALDKAPEKRPRHAGEFAARLGSKGLTPAPLAARRAYRAGRSVVFGAIVIALVLGGWEYLRPSPPVPPASSGAFPSDASRALAAWNFDGDARDGSGRGFDGRLREVVPTIDRFGRIDRALHFNGNAEVVVPDAPAFRWSGAQSFTAALWIRNVGDELATGSIWRSVGDEVGSFVWSIGLDHGHPAAGVDRVQVDGSHKAVTLAAETGFAPGEWHHVALVSDGAGITLFVDGTKCIATALGLTRAATAPNRVELRLGRIDPTAPWSLSGDIDDVKLWRRALAVSEIADLASRMAPPRFSLSHGAYADTDDFGAAVRAEFGENAQLADWAQLKRLHSDDARSWSDEIGLKVGQPAIWLQRAGKARYDARRRYFLDRFDGIKPAYYLVHDEFGGMTCALGSWYGNRLRFLAAQPPAPARTEALRPDASGILRRDGPFDPGTAALALSWRLPLAPDGSHGATLALRLRDGRELRAVCRTLTADMLAVALGDVADGSQTWQCPAVFANCEFTVVVRQDLLRFRAVSTIGGTPLFQRDLPVKGLGLSEILSLELHGASGSPVTSARLIVE